MFRNWKEICLTNVLKGNGGTRIDRYKCIGHLPRTMWLRWDWNKRRLHLNLSLIFLTLSLMIMMAYECIETCRSGALLWLIAVYRVFLESLIVAQLDKAFPAFIEPVGSLPYSQKPATRHTVETVDWKSTPSHPIYLRCILILCFQLSLGLPLDLPYKIPYAFLGSPCLLHTVKLSLCLIKYYTMKINGWVEV